MPQAAGAAAQSTRISGSSFLAPPPPLPPPVTIAPKELAPIILAVAMWGPQGVGSKVCAQCDNMAVVYAINKKSGRDPTLANLLRLLALLCAVYDITLGARHLPGIKNTLADALSRNNLSLFLSLNPQASHMPTIIPSPFSICYSVPPTNPQNWTVQLRSILQMASLCPPVQPTPKH